MCIARTRRYGQHARGEATSEGADVVAIATTAAWQQGLDALRDAVAQVTTLLRSVRDPGAHAVGQWNLGEVAMHLPQVWIGLPELARQDLSRTHEAMPILAGVAGHSRIKDVWELGETTILEVKSDPERDPRVLADRIEARAQEYLNIAHAAGRRWRIEPAHAADGAGTIVGADTPDPRSAGHAGR
jgi:hypothetical protein